MPRRDTAVTTAPSSRKARTLFARLYESGVITAAQPTWCRKVYLALLHEVYLLPADAAELADGGDEVGSRSALLIRSVLGALGGKSSSR